MILVFLSTPKGELKMENENKEEDSALEWITIFLLSLEGIAGIVFIMYVYRTYMYIYLPIIFIVLITLYLLNRYLP